MHGGTLVSRATPTSRETRGTYGGGVRSANADAAESWLLVKDREGEEWLMIPREFKVRNWVRMHETCKR